MPTPTSGLRPRRAGVTEGERAVEGERYVPAALPAKKFPLFPAPPAHIHSSPVGGKAAETKLGRGGEGAASSDGVVYRVVCAHKLTLGTRDVVAQGRR